MTEPDHAVDVPEQLHHLRVAQVGYRDEDGGDVVRRVDLIDRRTLQALASLSPEDAVRLADRLRDAAGRAAAGKPEPAA